MLQPTELRIGNLLYWNRPHGTKGIIRAGGVNESSEFENFEAIPFTPEILEYCGFITKAGSPFWKHDKHHFYISLEDDNLILFQVINTDPVEVVEGIHFSIFIGVGQPMQYLHQLQNLFFCITGEELRVSGKMIFLAANLNPFEQKAR